MAEPIALASLALDASLGWPARLYAQVGHPVGGFARVIEWGEVRWNRPALRPGVRRLLGVLQIALLVAGIVLLCHLFERVIAHFLGSWAWVAVAALAWPALAQRSLYDHVRAVADALSGENLPAARQAVAKIVGRDTADLDESGVSRAAIESLAESFCDGVAAPLFWLLVAGLPGIWAYKAVNTADSLIGHKEERWRTFGWAAARSDDVANFIPARLSGLIICLVAGRGWRTMWRDCRRHASPNGGWPEAAMAGALGVALAGPVAYDEVMHAKPWIGENGRAASRNDVRRALVLYVRACAVLWVIAGGVAWAR